MSLWQFWLKVKIEPEWPQFKTLPRTLQVSLSLLPFELSAVAGKLPRPVMCTRRLTGHVGVAL